MKTPIHIILLAGLIDRNAGSHVYHLELTENFISNGYKVSLVCFKAPAFLLKRCTVYEINPPAFEASSFIWRFASLLRYSYCSHKLRQTPIEPADIIIAGEHVFLPQYVRMFPNIPLIYLPHSLLVKYEIDSYNLPLVSHWVTRFLYGWLQRKAVYCADRIVRFTSYAAKALINKYGEKIRSKVIINPMPVDYQDPPASLEVHYPPRLLFVGRVVESKNLGFLLRVLATLSFLPWKLNVVGDGPQRNSAQSLAKALKIADRVNFLGFHPDPYQWYRSSDLLVFPSLLESCGKVVLEAMSVGLPCLAIKADKKKYFNAFEDLVVHNLTGFLAEGEEDFKNILEKILNQPEKLARMRTSVYRDILKHHLWSIHMKNYTNLFHELLGQKIQGKKKTIG